MSRAPDLPRHPALEGGGDGTLEEVSLSDRQKLAVVLQAAALLAHLEHGGWYLSGGWSAARLSSDGRLYVAGLERGRPREPPQVTFRRLLERLFCSEATIAGRGEARRAARWLLERWRQTLVPVPLDAAVGEVLEAAAFLWQESFGVARKALVAEHRGASGRYLWVVGPGAVRRRLLALGLDRPALAELLAGDRGRALWEGWREDVDPMRACGEGRWQTAVVAWHRRPPATRSEALAHARALHALGRYGGALDALKGASGIAARLLRARCQLELGQLRAARGTVRRLQALELSSAETLELAEVAVRLEAKRGRAEELREWVARALEKSRGRQRLRALILAAEAAWDAGEPATMHRCLEASRDALDEDALARRWRHARALRCLSAGDGAGMVEQLGTVLRRDRRRLLRAEAGRLWNDLALGRVLVDDFAGAERACRHALRLLSACEGPSRTTLGLYNLAEVRLRRGRVAGVAEVLEASTAENRRAGNLRGLVRDLGLWVRLELVQGRPVAALARCAEARRELDRRGSEEGRALFELLAARAHGWLGQRRRAARCLEEVTPESLGEVEPEERPALYALAGVVERALELAEEGAWGELWCPLVSGDHPPPGVWENLRRLEAYRAARLVFDCELVHPGAAPPSEVRRASAALRRAGAEALAERLESRSLGAWNALERYLERPADAPGALADLFAGAGYDDARLSLERADGERVLVAGAGGGEVRSARRPDGRLSLRAESLDAVLRALFALLARDLPVEEPSAAMPTRAVRGAIVGEDPALLRALERLALLARGELPILVLGESGTGKELVAREAHRSSPRAAEPFLAVNCAALSETLVLSDLFGHVRGAFTGADRDRPGVFESARGGTVFLDEIGDLPLTAQGMLLRVLQEGEMRRVGESFTRKVDVRIVAATHRKLEEMVRESSFRQDLFYRLKVATIELPPLRERGRDVLLLADHFLERRGGVLATAARARLLSHSWPGNVRELQNVLEVAAALAVGGEITPEHLDLPATQPGPARGDYHLQVEGFRRKLVSEALEASGGRQSEAARRLGLTRQALSYLVRQLGLS